MIRAPRGPHISTGRSDMRSFVLVACFGLAMTLFIVTMFWPRPHACSASSYQLRDWCEAKERERVQVNTLVSLTVVLFYLSTTVLAARRVWIRRRLD